MTDDLVAFLTARLDEKRALATRVAARYVKSGPYSETPGEPIWPLPTIEAQLRGREPEIAEGLDLIKLYSPARVLAEVEAARRIIAEHPHYKANSPDSAYWTADFGCGTCHIHQHDGGIFGEGWCKTLRLLALPDASHPSYREEWRP